MAPLTQVIGNFMQPKMLTNFNGVLRVDGEDHIAYKYENSTFVLTIKYEDSEKEVSVCFDGCLYFFQAPFFGYSPFERKGSQLENKSMPEAGALYEHFETDMMLGAEAAAEKWGTSLTFRHFSIFFETTGLVFDFLARGYRVLN